MIGFLFRIAFRAATVQRYRFLALTFTIVVSSALLVILSSLYLNAESSLQLELSGVPNFVVEPKKSLVELNRLSVNDLSNLKSKDHFWRNNIVNAVPVKFKEGQLPDRPVKLAGTWFRQEITLEDESYTFGLLSFKGWKYQGEEPDANSIVVGANILSAQAVGETLKIKIGDSTYVFRVAGILQTGSFWDDYIFTDLNFMNRISGSDNIDQILVSALIKPKDQLAVKAEVYGLESLTPEEFETWYCSPYASTIAYTINEVIPHARVKILRRITEVQEGIIRASNGVFIALFLFTLVASVLAIFSAEKMYVAAKLKEFGIMAVLGATRQRTFIQLMTEISIAAFFSVIFTVLVSRILVGFINQSVFGTAFSANITLLILSTILPFVLSGLVAMILVKKMMDKNVIEILR